MSDKDSISGMIILVLGSLVWWNWPDDTKRPDHMTTPALSAQNEEPTPVIVMGNGYKDALVLITDKFRGEYFRSQNDVQKGKTRIDRGVAVCKALPSNLFENWSGELIQVSTSNDGSIINFIKIRIGENISIVQNSLFGRGFSEGDKIYELFLNKLKEGDQVLVSGTLAYDQGDRSNDCFREMSLTLGGGMTHPEYSVKFEDIRPLQP